MSTTIYKEELFNRLFTYLTNYDKQEPVTYNGFLKLPQTHILMQHFDYNPYIATMAILYYTGKFTKNEITNLDKKYKAQLNNQNLMGWFKKLFGLKDLWTSITTFYNSFDVPENLLNACESILETSFQEQLPYGESPVDVPTYVKHIFLENAPDLTLEGINDYIATTGKPISYSNVNEILQHSINIGKQKINDYKLYYLNMKPIELFNQCINEPDLITRLYNIKDDEFRQTIQSNYNQGQLEYLLKLKSNCIANKEHTQEDLNYMNRMQCGLEEGKIQDYLCNSNPDDGFTKDNANTKNVILESLQNTGDVNQVKLDSTSSDPSLAKILGIAGGVTLLGGGAYAGYKLWQLKKQQQLEKQRQEEQHKQIQEHILYSKSNSRKRSSVFNNVINANTKPNIEYNI